MYDELIIEEIRRKNRIKEEEDRRQDLWIETPDIRQKNSKPPEDDQRGIVVIIDLMDIEN